MKIATCLLLLSLLITGCSAQNAETASSIDDTSSQENIAGAEPNIAPELSNDATQDENSEIIEIPYDVVGVEYYINAIGGNPGQAKTALIEASVLSLSDHTVCPLQEEVCSVTPYPLNTGVIRIEQVLEYQPNDESSDASELEDTAEAGDDSVQSSPQNLGIDVEEQKEDAQSTLLSVGQEVEALFVFTSKPAIVRYTNLPEERLDDKEIAEDQAAAYYPLPQENGLYVFTLPSDALNESGEKRLPGLLVGDRFQAVVQFNGHLYVKDYSLAE